MNEGKQRRKTENKPIDMSDKQKLRTNLSLKKKKQRKRTVHKSPMMHHLICAINRIAGGWG